MNREMIREKFSQWMLPELVGGATDIAWDHYQLGKEETQARLDEATAILRELVDSFPEFGTGEEINGADAVDTIGVLVGKAQDFLGDTQKYLEGDKP